MKHEFPIAISAGDPAGIGPSVSLTAAYAARDSVRCVLFGDLAQLRGEAVARGYELDELVERDESTLSDFALGSVALVDVGRVAPAVIARHAPSPEGGTAQLEALRRAASVVRRGQARALVTGPTSKGAISSAGHAFIGQTEFLARLDGVADDAVTMLFIGPRLRVALVTTHLSIAEVPSQITRARVVRSAQHLAEVLRRLVPERTPSLAICGLNPHAGEAGLFGREELDVLEPALAALRARAPFLDGAVRLSGPVPAESVFRAAQRGDVDGVVAMFHDQATIASKLLDWGAAVNTTWGLSFLRTSVDHGVAYDAARDRTPDADGMKAALALAVRLTAAPHG
ncbi:MAG: 4-hydroxythreonine-4-phosphate dehydrogenase [Myxococcaceae bacterium]|nr:4-hydroxythreonine-4-phosphate dehydrogenase [Myxococcaceae bacterium]